MSAFKIDKRVLRKIITSRFKGMYGRGADSIKIDIEDNIVDIEVTFGLNHIEEQLLTIEGGKELVIESREHIFNEHLQANIDLFSGIVKRKITNFNISRDMELRISRLSIELGDALD